MTYSSTSRERDVQIAHTVRTKLRGAALGASLLLMGTQTAFAGPPFFTDDPEPVDYGHFDTYLFTAGTHEHGETAGTAVGFDVSYGVLPDTQINAIIPFEYEPVTGGGTKFALHDLSFDARYRFVHQDESGWLPDVSFATSVEVPISEPAGENAPAELFTLLAQKSFGDWTTFGGGGFNHSEMAGSTDFWSFGLGLIRQLTPRFALGVETFGQSSDEEGGDGSAGAGIGAVYDINDEWHVLGSVNTGVLNRTSSDHVSYYVAVEWTI